MTVEELRQRMTAYELRGWQLFEDKYGPLYLPVRIDAAVARAVSPFIKDFKREYFMPWPKQDEEVASVEQIFGLIAGAAKDKRKRPKRKPKPSTRLNKRKKGQKE